MPSRGRARLCASLAPCRFSHKMEVNEGRNPFSICTCSDPSAPYFISTVPFSGVTLSTILSFSSFMFFERTLKIAIRTNQPVNRCSICSLISLAQTPLISRIGERTQYHICTDPRSIHSIHHVQASSALIVH